MAISFIGSNTQDSGGAQSLTFAFGGISYQADDLGIVFVKQSENTGGQEWDDDGGGGNGWTRLAYNRTTGGRDQETAIYWKILSGSETDPTFTWDVGGTNEPMSGSLLVYRGTDLTTPIQDWGFLEAQNDSSPPNPSVTTTNIPATFVVFHAATHDDISAVAAPTGYTLKTQVWNGVNDDHRNHFTADLIGDNSLGSYTPPDWQHTTLNNTPEYHTYTLALQEPVLIQVDDFNTTEKFNWGDNNLVLTGFGFESVQGTGKVEFWDDTSGTTKVLQTIDTWNSDTSITIDTVQGALSGNTTVYLVVTNDNGDESAPLAIVEGLPPYTSIITDKLPDHYWKLNNTYNDTGSSGDTRNMTVGVVGGGTMVTTLIAEDTTHSWNIDGITVRREISDSPNMNITISSQERTLSTWIQLGGIQQSLGAIWKEGGGVQNLAFLVGIGNVLMWQLADTAGTRDNVQAISDFRLTPGRPYHVVGRYSHTDDPAESRLYIDGIKQEVTDGNPMTLGIFDTHSGDVVWGDPDNSLETGGTDIAYAGQEDCLLAHFATWSDNSGGVNAGGLSDEEIFELFERGAIPTIIISSGTEGVMQTSLDAYIDTERPDAPLAFRIESPTGGGDLELVADNITFNSRISLNIQWVGTGTLTWVLENGSSIDSNKFSTPAGGNIVIANNVSVKVTVRDIDDNSIIENARVLLEASSGGDLTDGDDILTGLTDSNGELEITDFRFTNNQGVKGWVRKASSAPYYKQSLISGTIAVSGLDITIFMIKDQ